MIGLISLRKRSPKNFATRRVVVALGSTADCPGLDIRPPVLRKINKHCLLQYSSHLVVFLGYFAFVLSPFRTMECKTEGSLSFKHFQMLKVAYVSLPKVYFCAKRVSIIIVWPKEILLSFSTDTFFS